MPFVPFRALRGFFLALAVVNVAIFLVLAQASGHITANEGRGYDGVYYIQMISSSVLDGGSQNTRLRPVIVLLNWPAYRLLGDAITAFFVMNCAYIAGLTVIVLLLARQYGATSTASLFLALNLGLSISTSKYFAYYPTLIDLGAYVVITIALYCIVRGWRASAMVLSLVAALTRESAIAVALFGLGRDWRQGAGMLRSIATYGPALALAVLWRLVIARTSTSEGPYNGTAWFLQNLQSWRDPQFAALFLYFSATIFGGLSLLLIARAGEWIGFLRREPEWLAYALPVAAAAATGGPDFWRFIAYLLPVAVVLLSVSQARWSESRRRLLYAGALVATIVTQRPLEAMDIPSYFLKWFPYYLVDDRPPGFASYWNSNLLLAGAFVASFVALGSWLSKRDRGQDPDMA